LGGAPAETLFASAHGSLVGVDQINLRIPRSQAGRGKVDLMLQVDGKTANAASLNIR
jgi:uncharacterized protein (TIGR03437 family)